MAGLFVTNLLPSSFPFLVWKSACVRQEQLGAVSYAKQGAEQTPDILFCKRLIPRNAGSQNMHTALCNTQEGRGQISSISFSFFSEFWCQSVMLIPELKSGKRRVWGDRRQTQLDSRWGCLQAFWLMKAYSYENVHVSKMKLHLFSPLFSLFNSFFI